MCHTTFRRMMLHKGALQVHIDSDGLLTNIVPITIMPPYFLVFYFSATEQLHELATNGYRLLRWRLAIESTDEFYFRLLQYSRTNGDWRTPAHNLTLSISTERQGLS